MLVARDPGGLGRGDPLLQPLIDLDEDVVVARVLLHHFRGALVVHQDDRHARRRDDSAERSS